QFGNWLFVVVRVRFTLSLQTSDFRLRTQTRTSDFRLQTSDFSLPTQSVFTIFATMFVQQLYTNCLAEAAYYIESNGEVAIVDPIREIEPYIALAESRGSKIKYVFETHFHADFVSGHIDLAKKTGATIIFGPN